ncbi:hypothetical protein CRG98_042082 [Punica granatum]|uniref:Uncharacterized protein n=1 Tax=Punica granatum TaxID=22663 RepID=A0A2I0I0N5_PUNGR|nr:hypothetical protein CRG98_042082 [Punica granatum]
MGQKEQAPIHCPRDTCSTNATEVRDDCRVSPSCPLTVHVFSSFSVEADATRACPHVNPNFKISEAVGLSFHPVSTFTRPLHPSSSRVEALYSDQLTRRRRTREPRPSGPRLRPRLDLTTLEPSILEPSTSRSLLLSVDTIVLL